MIKTMADIRRANRAARHYFFEPDTLEFFSSRICDGVYPHEQTLQTLFITSEQFEDGNFIRISTPTRPLALFAGGDTEPRRYTIRAAQWDSGHIETLGDFQAFPTLDDAVTFIQWLFDDHWINSLRKVR